MADSAELTGSQNPTQTSFYAFSESKANDPPLPNNDPYSPEVPYRGSQQSSAARLPRNSSLQALPSYATSGFSTVPSSFSASRSRASSISKSQHARQLSLQHSLEKPLPVTPPAQPSPASPTTPLSNFQSLFSKLNDLELSKNRYTEFNMDSRTSTMDSTSSAAASQMYASQERYINDLNTSMTSLVSSIRHDGGDDLGNGLNQRSNGSTTMASAAVPQARSQSVGAPVGGPSQGSSPHLSGLMCNVHRTTGREPPPLVGATTTILGDKLYVFGGRILSRNRPAPLTSDLFELDLIQRHWTKLEAGGDVPPPRYFHSMCPLGDTKMVCYGGMSPAPNQPAGADQQQQEVAVMSDIYVYDVPTKRWTYIPAHDPPQGRYAHCACILPSSATFSSKAAPLSALQHNPSSVNPNEGQIGIKIDGTGGAQMVIVGGQDAANHYIEQVSVFNLRSLRWTSTQPLGKSCGAYRSVAAPLHPSITARIGEAEEGGQEASPRIKSEVHHEAQDSGSSMLIYSNYNFMDVKLELQIRAPDGTLTEKHMSGNYSSPPGLRFPNGGIIDTHFVVSGTYLTSSKQEYALWALDLRSLTWSRIDAGGSVFSQGSWNRGVLWNRRNTFVILGNRKRSLVDDYNHRRINFSNVCMVELEAFGFYDNPRKKSPMSGFISASSPYSGSGLKLARKAGYTAGGRFHSHASERLGALALSLRELADMDILCLNGERIPVNSRIVARRWGPYFVQLLREGTATQDGSDVMTLRSGLSSNPLRASTMTVTPSTRKASDSMSSMSGISLSSSASTMMPPATADSTTSAGTMTTAQGEDINPAMINTAPTPRSLPPNSRPRILYLPHTVLTVQALLHFLYTSSLHNDFCTPQILCSLLQIARPYRIDGLLEAVVERLHALLDSRNAAAVFNATAMAAGGGRGIDGSLNPNFFVGSLDPVGSPVSTSDFSLSGTTVNDSFSSDVAARTASLSLDTSFQPSGRPPSGEVSATTSVSGSEWGSEVDLSDRDTLIWNGELSSVIGLQKRGLRGLMEGRRIRERNGTGSGSAAGLGAGGIPYGNQAGGQRLGLGIAGP